MKLFIVVSCFFANTYAISESYKSKAMGAMSEITEKCVKRVDATEEDIAELMEKKPPTRKQGKCLMLCFSKEVGMIKNGKIDREGTLKMLEPLKADDAEAYAKVVNVMNKVFEEMANEEEEDECEYAFKLEESINRVAKELNIDLDSFMV
ncbi:hypothetical protein FQA39_LY04399 [Lamprigera yunnana]|nr:hypothetical protein FQA39_LY04399 [Lamprigera yunnana]